MFPIAGPPCFLDDDLFAFNDLDDDPANIFPDQTVFLDALEAAGISGGELLVPGTVATLADGACTLEQPPGDAAPDAIFGDKRAAIERYRDDWREWLVRERASWPRNGVDVVGALRDWWEPLLDVAPLTRAGVGAPVLLHVGDVGVLIDFPAGTVREWAGEPVEYRIDTDRALVESCIERHIEDWVNELFLSCRFRAHRDGPYNEYVYTFFKCLSLERMAYCEGHYASRSEPSDEMFRCGDYMVQKRCPHLRADLERFGTVEDGVLECMVHHWQFDLETGRCLTSDDDEHVLRTIRISDCSGLSVLIDLHAHTAPRSNCSRTTLEELVENGAGGASTRSASPSTTCAGPVNELADASRLLDFPLIPGVELTTDVGHVLVFGPLRKPLWLGYKLEELVEECEQSDTALVLPHPVRRLAGERAIKGGRVPPLPADVAARRSGRPCTRSRSRAPRPRRSSTR